MKKIILLAFLAYFADNASAQIFSRLEGSANLQKEQDSSGKNKSDLDVKLDFVTCRFFLHINHGRSIQGEKSEFTLGSLGYGNVQNFYRANLAWGIGVSGLKLSERDKIFVGNTAYLNFEDRSFGGFEAEADITYALLPDNHKKWTDNSVLLGKAEVTKFFRHTFGIGLGYSLRQTDLDSVKNTTEIISPALTFKTRGLSNFAFKFGADFWLKKSPSGKNNLAGFASLFYTFRY